MKRRVAIATLALTAWSPDLARFPPDSASDQINNVSLIRLIANPSIFDKRRLRLAGYLDYNGIDQAVGLYVSEIDGRNAIYSNSIDLNIDLNTAREFLSRYVILEATFHAPEGHTSNYLNGSLSHISGIKKWIYGDTGKDHT